MSVTEVAKQFGVNVNTIYAILKRDDVRKMQYELACNEMRDGTIKAARLLVKQLDDDNPWIAQNAARTILQWAQAQEERDDHSIVVTFEGMTDPDKVQKVMSDGTVETEGSVS